MKYYDSREYVLRKAKNIKPALKYTKESDFIKWKFEAKEKLVELLGINRLEKCDDEFKIIECTETDNGNIISFEFQSEEEYYIAAKILMPANSQKPLPAVICLQGHATGKHISLGECVYEGDEELIAGGRDFAVQAVKNGYCAICIDQRYMGTAGHTDSGIPLCITKNTVMPTLHLGRTPIGERVWDVSRLIDVVEKYFSEIIDVNKIICLGNSAGGTTTFYSACVDERIFMSVSSCAVCSYDSSILSIVHCDCNYIPNIRNFFDMGDLGCLIAPRKFIMVNGEYDTIFPLSGARECYDTIKEIYTELGVENNCCMIVGKGGHQFYPDDVWPILNKMCED